LRMRGYSYLDAATNSHRQVVFIVRLVIDRSVCLSAYHIATVEAPPCFAWFAPAGRQHGRTVQLAAKLRHVIGKTFKNGRNKSHHFWVTLWH